MDGCKSGRLDKSHIILKVTAYTCTCTCKDLNRRLCKADQSGDASEKGLRRDLVQVYETGGLWLAIAPTCLSSFWRA